MQAFARNSAVGDCYRGVAIVLLLLLVVTPSCTSICQARACSNSQASNSDSDCHHEQGIGPDGPRLMVAGPTCWSHDLVAVLPAGKASLPTRVTSSGSRDVSSFEALGAEYSPVSTHVSFANDSGPAGFSHRSATRHLSFDRSVTLRI